MSAIEEDALLPLSSCRYAKAADHWEKPQNFTEQKRCWPTSTPKYSDKSFDYENQLVCYTGPLRSPKKAPVMPVTMSGPIYYGDKADNSLKPSRTDSKENKTVVDQHEHLLRSGPLGVCNDPYCSICPTHFHNNSKAMQEKHGKDQKQAKADLKLLLQFQNNLHGEAGSWSRRFFSNLRQHIPGVINPHSKFMQRWNRFFVISCLLAIFVDPLFFFLLTVKKENKCLDFDWRLAKVVVLFRSATDFIYLLHMLLQVTSDNCQFKLAYILPESQVVGAGVLVDHPKKIARNYLRKGFWIDLAVVLPLPQIMILLKQPNLLDFAGANETKNVLRAIVLIQYLPRFYRFLPLLAGQSANGFIFESAWANFVINLFAFVLAGHLVGSGWYLFGLQRVNQCLRDACHKSQLSPCKHLIDCGNNQNPDYWRNNSRANSCFDKEGFPYGIYVQAVNLTTERSVATRYTYSLFWGFQQISTVAGNQIPSYFIWEVLFTMAIVGLGLLLFALLIGNMHNFLQALGRRRLEMMLRRRDVDLWMSHRRLPVELRRKVRAAERYNWTASRGVDEEMLMANLPEDLQTGIRRHLFKFLKKVRILSVMDEPILDSISEKLRHRTYIRGGHILVPGDPIKRITFIVRGILESVGEDGIGVQLSEGDVCGQELLSWCLEHSSVSKDTKKWRTARQRPISNRT
uniref:Cyclic nucleotide-binding domain-containing protein n=1 Tax=Kalanchoe fedtschenkoi TaxID=63787 RepID=A0A7N0U3S7_KALFE